MTLVSIHILLTNKISIQRTITTEITTVPKITTGMVISLNDVQCFLTQL
jgi:hypothetical protein